MNYTLDLLSDSSERIPYNNQEIPVYVNRGRIFDFCNFSAPGHWHDDLEFSLILQGHMSYNVNGTVYVLEQGEGMFVNSRQFHSNYSSDGTDCLYICVLVHPILLCANQHMENKYIFPVISNKLFSYAILKKHIPWHKELLCYIQKIYELYSEKKKTFHLLAHSLFYQVWSLLYENMPEPPQSALQTQNWLSALHGMIGFIQKHYNEKISLADIAASGNVCQSNCCAIFKKYLRQTPIGYLICYRLNKSVEFLKDPSLSITEISLASGFIGASYYTETFRKHFGCPPSEYRRKAAE